MTSTDRLIDGAVAAVGVAGLVWLAPLMADQLVFLGDQEQTRIARESRDAMLPAAGLLLLSAAMVSGRAGPWHALLTALPAFVSVPLAWALPDMAFQLLSYVLTAPLAMGALLSAGLPRPRRVSGFTVVAAGAILLPVAVAATTILALALALAGLAWLVLGRDRPVLMSGEPPG